MDKKEESPQEILDRLKAQLNKLIHIYDQYFLGNITIEPTKERADFKRAIQKVKLTQTRWTFQLGQLRSTFTTYCNLWDRKLQERYRE